MAQQPSPRVVNTASAPIFFSFFTWGFGTGAQNLGRPLFALALTGNVFLVGLLLASNAVPRFFTGPLTGYLTDRFGRKPMVILGNVIRGLSNIGQFFAPDFTTFFILEIIGQIGVSMWNTSANVLLSDVTSTENRGRVLAVRHMSMRLGFVAGPMVGGILAAAFGLRWVFLLNGVSKLIIVATVLFLVRETLAKREPSEGELPARRRVAKPSLAPFRDRTFAALAIATAAFAMSQAGFMQTLIPVYAKDGIGVSAAAVGFLQSLGAGLAFLLAFPNGLVSDRYGRKVSLVPGLALTGVASMVLALSLSLDLGGGYTTLLFVVVLIGIGEAFTLGTTQTYAMDLAPAENRGTFIGTWTMSQSLGAIMGPLILAGLYEYVDRIVSFHAIAVVVLVSAVLMAVLGRETAGPRAHVEEPT